MSKAFTSLEFAWRVTWLYKVSWWWGRGRDWERHPTQCGSSSYRLHNLSLEMWQGGGFCLTRANQLPYYVIPWYFAHFEILPILPFGCSARQLCRVLGKLHSECERPLSVSLRTQFFGYRRIVIYCV